MVALANRLGDDITTFERLVTGQDLRPSGELRVTTTDVILLRLLQDVLVGFRRAYPKIVLDLIITNRALNLSKRDADIALRAVYPGSEHEGGTRLTDIAWAVYGPSRLATRPFDPLTEGCQHDWIAFADTVSIVKAMKWLKDHVPDERIVCKVNTLVGLAEAAAAGMGLALIPCFVGDGVPGLARLSAAIPELAGELWLVAHPDLRNSVKIRAFMDYCVAEIACRRDIIECRERDLVVP
jgi:DNA-binding transcriptional LysR family regulator